MVSRSKLGSRLWVSVWDPSRSRGGRPAVVGPGSGRHVRTAVDIGSVMRDGTRLSVDLYLPES